MFANLIPAPYFLRAAELVLNLADVRSIRFDWTEGGLRLAHVVHRDGMSEEYRGAIADALERAFRSARPVDAGALRARENPIVVEAPSVASTWTQPVVADAATDCATEDCRCQTGPNLSPIR